MSQFTTEELNALMDKYNPYPSLRETQRKAIHDIMNYYDPDAKDVIIIECPVPTAGGKTLINTIVQKILAFECDEDMVLGTTPLIELIKQYAKNSNYKDVPTLIGKSNYKCALYPEMSAEDCIMKGKKSKYHTACTNCEYKAAKQRFDNSAIGWQTFDGFLRTHRNIACLIIDECSSIESKLRNYYSLELPNEANIKELSTYLENYKIELEDELHNLEMQSDDMIEYLPDMLKEYTGINKKINKLTKQIENINQAIYFIESNVKYIIEQQKKKIYNRDTAKYDEIDIKVFKLLTAHIPFANMTKNLKMVILSSATPASHLLTIKHINKIETIHPIPKERRKIFFMPVGSMSFNSRIETAKKMAPVIAELHNKYGTSTMLHAGSYPIANLIYENLINYIPDENILLQTKPNRNTIIQDFYRLDNKILISVEYNEGIDLFGEKYQLNIIAKLPTEPWLAEYTKARNLYDKAKFGFNQWYDTQSANKLMQSYGRICRTPSDEGTTFVLDNAVYSFWNRYKGKLFYPWFNEAVELIRYQST